jgi:hypothetical protein
MLGNDGELDPTFLNVKHRLGDVPLCEDNLILLIFGYRFSVTHFCKKFLGIERDPSSPCSLQNELAVETDGPEACKDLSAVEGRNDPEIFILVFIIRRSCSARMLVKGTSKSVRKRSVSVLNVFSLSRKLL